MPKKFVCPECGMQEVEQMNACGASSYFCNNCKRLISSSRIDINENPQKDKDKA